MLQFRKGRFVSSQTLEERLAEKYIPEPNTGCFLWLGMLHKQGYGVIKIGKKNRLAHVVAYELEFGPVPLGFELDHVICSNPPCINPLHMKVATHRENVLRGRSPSAINARKTICRRGHLKIPENVYPRNGGCRHCVKHRNQERVKCH